MALKKVSSLLLIMLVTSIFITIFHVPVGQGQEENGAEQPEWHEGDNWDYKLEITNYSYSYDYTVEVMDTDTEHELNEEVYHCYDIEWRMSGMYNDNRTILRTKDGLNKVKEGSSEFYPPLNELDFPLTVGKTWDQDVTTYQENITMEYTYEFECKKKTTLELNGEEFQCYKISKKKTHKNTTSTQNSNIFYSPRAKRIVKRVIHTESGYGGYTMIFKLKTFSISPSEPRGLNATVDGDEVELDWEEPEYPGGSEISEYRIYRWEENSSQLLATVEDRTNYTDDNISDGHTYRYEVAAVNDKGESDMSQNVMAEIPEDDEGGFFTDYWWILAVVAAAAVILTGLYRYNRKKRYERPPQGRNNPGQ